jgi:hypothetical protein
MSPRSKKTRTSALGDQLRRFAAGYAATGSTDRAEGLLQAADAVDAAISGDPMARLASAVVALERVGERLTEAAADLASAALTMGSVDRQGPAPRRCAPRPARRDLPEILVPKVDRPAPPLAHSNGALPKGERAVLTAIAQHPDGVTRQQLTILTGYKRRTRDAYLQRLIAREAARVHASGRIHATTAGIADLGPNVQPLPKGSALASYWLDNLPVGEARLLQLLRENAALTREQLSELSGYQRRTRDAYLQRLKARELIVDGKRDGVRLSPELQ